jgi:hydrogenase assembly chaperone HypC/HupF
MCLTRPAEVVEVRPDTLLVEVDGRRQVVTNLLESDVRAGDQVLVGLGRALTVLPPAEAARLRELLASIDQTPDRV